MRRLSAFLFLLVAAAGLQVPNLSCMAAEWVHVGSSVFDAVKYDSGHKILVIRDIRGKVVSFQDVPSEVYNEFMETDLKGGYFKARIHGKYPHFAGDRLETLSATVAESAPAPQQETPIGAQSPPPVRVSITEEEQRVLQDATFGDLVSQSIAEAEGASRQAGITHYAHEGRGIIGRKLWFFDVGGIRPGDELVREVDDTVAFFATGLNLPVTEHLAFNAGLGYAELDGTVLLAKEERYVSYQRRYYRYYNWLYAYTVPVARTRVVYYEEDYNETVLTGNVGFTLSLLPGEALNPFLGAGASYSDWDATLGDESWNDSSSGWLISAGVELNPSALVTIVPSITHAESSDAEETSLSLLGALWVTPRIGVRVAGGYGTKSKNRSFQGGIMAVF